MSSGEQRPQQSHHPQQQRSSLAAPATAVAEVLPKAGLVVSERGAPVELLCKPKLLPLKSAALRRLEALEAQAAAAHATQQRAQTAAAAGARPATGGGAGRLHYP